MIHNAARRLRKTDHNGSNKIQKSVHMFKFYTINARRFLDPYTRKIKETQNEVRWSPGFMISDSQIQINNEIKATC